MKCEYTDRDTNRTSTPVLTFFPANILPSFVRGEQEKVRAGALDGYVIHEGAYFEPRHTQWCELLSAPS